MSTDGFTLNTQLTASINTRIYSQQITPSIYHNIIRVPITQAALFSTANYQDSGNDVTVNLTVNSTLQNFLATSATALHGLTYDANKAVEWTNLSGATENSGLNLANPNFVTGYYNSTLVQYSAPLISSARTFGACLLDIIAKATFNHPGAKAAIANDAAISAMSVTALGSPGTVSLAAHLFNQISTNITAEAQSIFDQYVADYPDRYATDQVGSDFNDVTAAKNFNFAGTKFYAYLALTSTNIATASNDTVGNMNNEVEILPLSSEVPGIFARIIRIDFEVAA